MSNARRLREVTSLPHDHEGKEVVGWGVFVSLWIICDRLNGNRLVSAVLLFCAAAIAGCGLQYIDRASPPEEAYWSKPGYTMAMTREFLYEKCGYSNRWGDDEGFEEYLARYETCMLDHGFLYMEDAYEITSLGFRPLSRDFCKAEADYKKSPACRSIMKKIR